MIKLLQFILILSFIIILSSGLYDASAQTQRNPVIEFCTGTWCQWCPCGDYTIENLLQTYPHLIPLAYHGPVGSDPYAGFSGNQIISLMGFSGYPTATIDRNSSPGDYTTWPSKVYSRINVPATVSIELQKTFNESTHQLNAAIYITPLQNLTGQYIYNIVLTEDSLVYTQTNNGVCMGGGTNWIHYWVVRSMINGASGENLNTGSSWNTGNTIMKSFSYNVSAGFNPYKCGLIVFVYKQNSPMYLAEIQQAEKYPLISPVIVASPNGAESWEAGNTYNITWSASFSENVKIELYKSNVFNSIITASAPNSGSFDWTIPENQSGEGNYKIKISSVNDFNKNDFSDQNFSIFQPSYELTVSISGGWNLVSIPGNHPYGNTVGNWWPYRDSSTNVYRYSYGYQSIDTVVPGSGYWLKHNSSRTYNTGEEWPAEGIIRVPHNQISINAGWNLFGGYEDTVEMAALTTSPPGQLAYPVYQFLPGTGYQAAAWLVPGYGYWVRALSACQVIVPDNLPGNNQKAAGHINNDLPADWGKIKFTDASGSSYTLYAMTKELHGGEAEMDMDRYELPPLPPSGLFDIRFGTGRIAENLFNSVKSIEMSGINYPLKISAEGIDIRLKDLTGKELNTNLKSGSEISLVSPELSRLIVSSEFIPGSISLEQNFPNPFNPVTTIEFELPENEINVKLIVYSILGEKITELVNGPLQAGTYHYEWNAKAEATGLYIYELRTEKFISVKKMLLLK